MKKLIAVAVLGLVIGLTATVVVAGGGQVIGENGLGGVEQQQVYCASRVFDCDNHDEAPGLE